MGRPKGSKNKPKDLKPEKRPRGRPRKSQEYRDSITAEIESEKKRLTAEFKEQRKIEMAAEIMARRDASDELEQKYPDMKAARAKWEIDKDKLQTHNQYITAIAMLPTIDANDPVQVKQRVEEYMAIATAAGQRMIFETCALALGMPRRTLGYRCTNQAKMTQELRDVYLWISSILQTATAEYAHSGESNAIATIFFARNNLGYTNEDPKQVYTNDEDSAEQSNEEIAKKYGDLPV